MKKFIAIYIFAGLALIFTFSIWVSSKMKSSSAFKTSLAFAEKNAEIKNAVCEITSTSHFISGTIVMGENATSNFKYKIYGSCGEIFAEFTVQDSSGVQRVTSYRILE